ncbi:MAG: acyltransferase family protein [Cellulophaga sp.]|nr:acyltransferase family protein [Cellulophaga sp.]
MLLNKALIIMGKERILYIDRLRGINIMLVVMGHVITRNVIDGESSGILVWGSTFRMPLFMFLCGYIASKVIKPKIFKKYGSFLLKKSRTLLVPFFAWPLLVDNFFFSGAVTFDVRDKFIELISGGGLWFLYFLFFITLLYSAWLFLSYKYNTANKAFIDLFFAGLLLGFLGIIWATGQIPFMTQFVLFFVFYFLGVFVAKYKALSTFMMHRMVFSVALLAFFVLVGYYEYGFSSMENSGIKMICAISGISVFYFLIRHVSFPEKVDQFIRSWGVNSLAIYVTHFYVVPVFGTPFIPADFNQIPLFIITSLLTIIAVQISLYIFKILYLSSVFNFLLYGNNPKYY